MTTLRATSKIKNHHFGTLKAKKRIRLTYLRSRISPDRVEVDKDERRRADKIAQHDHDRQFDRLDLGVGDGADGM